MTFYIHSPLVLLGIDAMDGALRGTSWDLKLLGSSGSATTEDPQARYSGCRVNRWSSDPIKVLLHRGT
jgi:hypothetical protein